MRVCDQNYLSLVAILQILYPVTLFVQEVSCDFNRQLSDNFRRALLARFFANNAQDSERQRFGATNGAKASAARAGLVGRLTDRRTQALS